MKKGLKIIVYASVIGASLFGAWLLKKGFYDTGYSSVEEEREYLLDAVLTMRGLPISEQNKRLLQNMSNEELLKEIGLKRNPEGGYIELLETNF